MSELRRRLAAACGWTVNHVSDEDGGGNLYSMWVVDGPKGEYYEHSAESKAWEATPDYARDDGACLDALEATGCSWYVGTASMSNGYKCSIDRDLGTDMFVNYFGEGATRREAMVKALCRFYHVEVTE